VKACLIVLPLALYVGTHELTQQAFQSPLVQRSSAHWLQRSNIRHRAETIARRASEEADVDVVEADEEVEEEEAEPEQKIYKVTQIVKDNGLDLDGDKLDNLPEWYEEALTGNGGVPEKGFMRDLMLRSFFGSWNSKGRFLMSRKYSGAYMTPSQEDYDKAYSTMVENCKEGLYFAGQNDESGWIWLAATQTPLGLRMYFTQVPPYGERPLALIKESNVDEFFEKVDWYRLFVRMHKWNLWGGKATNFPFPVNGKIYQAKRVTRG